MQLHLLPLLLALVLTAHRASGVGCGEPIPDGADHAAACSDWQCSRPAGMKDQLSPTLNDTLYYCVRGFAAGEGPCVRDADCYHDLKCNTSSLECISVGDSGKQPAAGYAAIAVAVFCFGSNFIPVKQHVTGNGLYFQFVMAIAILVVGIGVQLYRKSPYIYPFAMLGGMFWALGNTLSVPVIQCIGLGLGITLWGATNMIMGWCSGKFGFFGVEPEAYKIEWMSYASVGVGCVAIVLFGLVKPSTVGGKKSKSRKALGDLQNDSTVTSTPSMMEAYPLIADDRDEHKSIEEVCPPLVRRLFGVFGALAAGLLFGLNFDPAQSMMGDYESKSLKEDVKYSPNGLDYVFSTNLGIFLTASGLLFFFSLIQDRTPTFFAPVDHARLFAPAFVSGLLWAVANVAWFIANTNLGLMVSFPIICLGPSVVASFWGIVLYKEIQGTANFVLLFSAFGVVGLSCFFTAYGKHGA